MVDWSLARQIARFAAGSPTTAPRLDADLPALVEESAGHLRAYTELEPSAPMPAPEPLGRAEWAEVNLDSLASLLEPVSERLGDRLSAGGPAAFAARPHQGRAGVPRGRTDRAGPDARAAPAARAHPVRDGRDRGLFGARDGRGGRAGAPCVHRAAGLDGPAPAEPFLPRAGAAAAARTGPQDAAVRGRQGLLRPGRGAQRDPGPEPGMGDAGGAADGRRAGGSGRLDRAHGLEARAGGGVDPAVDWRLNGSVIHLTGRRGLRTGVLRLLFYCR